MHYFCPQVLRVLLFMITKKLLREWQSIQVGCITWLSERFKETHKRIRWPNNICKVYSIRQTNTTSWAVNCEYWTFSNAIRPNKIIRNKKKVFLVYFQLWFHFYVAYIQHTTQDRWCVILLSTVQKWQNEYNICINLPWKHLFHFIFAWIFLHLM